VLSVWWLLGVIVAIVAGTLTYIYKIKMTVVQNELKMDKEIIEEQEKEINELTSLWRIDPLEIKVTLLFSISTSHMIYLIPIS